MEVVVEAEEIVAILSVLEIVPIEAKEARESAVRSLPCDAHDAAVLRGPQGESVVRRSGMIPLPLPLPFPFHLPFPFGVAPLPLALAFPLGVAPFPVPLFQRVTVERVERLGVPAGLLVEEVGGRLGHVDFL